MELQNIILRLRTGDRVRLQGVKFYVEPDAVVFVRKVVTVYFLRLGSLTPTARRNSTWVSFLYIRKQS